MAIYQLLAAVFLLQLAYRPISAEWETSAAVVTWLKYANSTDIKAILESSTTDAAHTYSIIWRPRMLEQTRRPTGSSRKPSKLGLLPRLQTSQRPQPSTILIPAEKQLLIKWISAHPRDIFRSGFVPKVSLGHVIDKNADSTATDLYKFYDDQHSSVYVSTFRITDWGPAIENLPNVFRYDIYAPGGINVEETLRYEIDSPKLVIAFVDGINTEYIFGAVEFDSEGKQIRYHKNPFFIGNEDIDGTNTSRCVIPTVKYGSSLQRQDENFCYASQYTSPPPTEYYRLVGTVPLSGHCSYWYQVNINFLQFYQGGESGDIEPYGAIRAYTNKDSTEYASTIFWRQAGNGDTPSVSNGGRLYNKRYCMVLQSGVESGPVDVCFHGYVNEYDPATGDDQIATFSNRCITTNPAVPTNSYVKGSTGADGSFALGFTIKKCDSDCMKAARFNANNINGLC